MKSVFFLTWRYLRYRPWRTVVLIVAVALIVYLPLAVNVFIAEVSRSMMLRAESTPLLLGPRGSAVELTLNSLYFTEQRAGELPYRHVQALAAKERGAAVPLHVGFRAGEFAIVGTTGEYFTQRNFGPCEMGLGECWIGSAVAEERGIGVGETINSTPDNLFDLGGAYPLALRVVGVLPASRSADDRAVFVSLETAWILEGLGHGHADVEKKDHASVTVYPQITEETAASFHFHGDEGDFPVSAALVFPTSLRNQALLLADYQEDEGLQLVKPRVQMGRLIDTVFSAKDFVFFGFLAFSFLCLALLGLVWSLAQRLREDEFRAYQKIGMTRRHRTILKVADLVIVLVVGAGLAMIGLLATQVAAASFLPGI